jgi:chorismate--pyruvate lyase
LRQADLPANLRHWLLEIGSLTERLRNVCPGRIAVKVLCQQWARPLPSEARVLGLTSCVRAWTREVQLVCDDQAWVFARTLIPRSTLRGPSQRLKRLGNRPLGEVLFAERAIQRAEVEVSHITTSHYLHRRAFGDAVERPDPLWGRRSVFYIAGRPLLVCEIFLPELPTSALADQTDALRP